MKLLSPSIKGSPEAQSDAEPMRRRTRLAKLLRAADL